MNSSAPTSSIRVPSACRRSLRIVGLFPELLGVGGVQEAGRLTAAALAEIVNERGGQTKFLSLNDAPGSHAMDVNGRGISLRGFGRGKLAFVFSGIRSVFWVRKEKAGVIIAAHPHFAVPAALMQRFSPRLKIIAMAHGIEVWNPISRARRRALLRASLVLAPSRYTAQKLAAVQGVPKEKIRVLPWPLNLGFLRMAADPAHLPLPPQFPTGRIILTVGRWAASERYKGADELIRAFAQLWPGNPDVRLVVIGGGDDLPRLVQLAASLRVSDCVRFLQGLSREQVAACYSRADIFALPSTGEGFGLVFLEAMAFAKPVVGAAVGGTMDVIEDGVNGVLVPPHDAQKLAGVLAVLLHDESCRSRLGQAGAEIVRKNYCFDVFKQALQRVLDECGPPQ
jgi:phosphatidyl-myo-inositol dimannoside synthase